jgi:hypothetical protein
MQTTPYQIYQKLSGKRSRGGKNSKTFLVFTCKQLFYLKVPKALMIIDCYPLFTIHSNCLSGQFVSICLQHMFFTFPEDAFIILYYYFYSPNSPISYDQNSYASILIQNKNRVNEPFDSKEFHHIKKSIYALG